MKPCTNRAIIKCYNSCNNFRQQKHFHSIKTFLASRKSKDKILWNHNHKLSIQFRKKIEQTNSLVCVWLAKNADIWRPFFVVIIMVFVVWHKSIKRAFIGRRHKNYSLEKCKTCCWLSAQQCVHSFMKKKKF